MPVGPKLASHRHPLHTAAPGNPSRNRRIPDQRLCSSRTWFRFPILSIAPSRCRLNQYASNSKSPRLYRVPTPGLHADVPVIRTLNDLAARTRAFRLRKGVRTQGLTLRSDIPGPVRIRRTNELPIHRSVRVRQKVAIPCGRQVHAFRSRIGRHAAAVATSSNGSVSRAKSCPAELLHTVISSSQQPKSRIINRVPLQLCLRLGAATFGAPRRSHQASRRGHRMPTNRHSAGLAVYRSS